MFQDKIVIAIVDDHPVVIEGLKTLLSTDPMIGRIESFTSGNDFLTFLKNNPVQLVLLDIMLPDANGIDLCKMIKALSPGTVVLALSNQAERSIILQALQNGASGYLLKNAAPAELLHCIDEALKGGFVFSNEVKEIMAKPGLQLKVIPSVTKREKHILQLLSEGKTTPVMAAELHLSPLTIDTHRRNLLQKFDVKNTAELLMTAVQHKLL